MVKNGQTYYLITDQVGSVRAVCDTSGNKEITYDSFGNILDDTAPTFTIPLGFAGGLHDGDTGLVRFGFRDYDPDSGRWTAKDPVQFASAEVELYSYCGNYPIGHRDRLGLYGLGDAAADVQALGHWWGYESIVPGPYGNPDAPGAGTWNNICEGPQQGTGWGTAQQAAIGVAAAATSVAAAAIAIEALPIGLKFGFNHSAHHYFAHLGRKAAHMQLNWWTKGVSKSGGVWRGAHSVVDWLRRIGIASLPFLPGDAPPKIVTQ